MKGIRTLKNLNSKSELRIVINLLKNQFKELLDHKLLDDVLFSCI